MPTDDLTNRGRSLDTVVDDIIDVTPSDSADLPDGPCIGIWVTGGDGNIAYVTKDGLSRTIPVKFSQTPSGIYPFRMRRIKATGTTATGIKALY